MFRLSVSRWREIEQSTLILGQSRAVICFLLDSYDVFCCLNQACYLLMNKYLNPTNSLHKNTLISFCTRYIIVFSCNIYVIILDTYVKLLPYDVQHVLWLYYIQKDTTQHKLYSTARHGPVRHGTVQCRGVPCHTVPYRTVQCRAVPCRAALYMVKVIIETQK